MKEIVTLRSDFLKADVRLKRFGKRRCKFHKNREKDSSKLFLECRHPAMAYGGLNRNTNCELVNCPRVLYDDQG